MKIAVIGCGNMSQAVVKNLYENDNSLEFYLYTPSNTRAIELASLVNGKHIKNIEDFNDIVLDFWLIGHKPQQLEDFSLEYRKLISKPEEQKIISMLAATDIELLEKSFNTKNIIRIMPNTPIGVGAGITLFVSAKDLEKEILSKFNSSFAAAGLINCSAEKELDILTTFSGCGPAYLFLFASTFHEKMTSLGFDSSVARELVTNLFLGSSKLMQSSSLDFSDLLDQVTSKGGVTIEAVNKYREYDLSNITSVAIDAALKKTEDMAQVINNNH